MWESFMKIIFCVFQLFIKLSFLFLILLSKGLWFHNLWEYCAGEEYEILEAETNLVEIQIHLLSLR
jgi:hypothetical protein